MKPPICYYYLITLVGFLISFRSFAQTDFPGPADYDSLCVQAKREGKPLFMIIHQRDEFFAPFGMSISKKTKNSIDEKFVSGIILLDPDDIDHPLHRAYHLTTPIYLFTDPDGFPLLRYAKKINDEDTLLNLIDSVGTIASGETMGKLLQQYKKGVRSRTLLLNLLKHYQAFDQYTDQQVLNDYLSQLTIQELNNFETVVFLLSCGPVNNSKSYRLARINDKMVDSLYATLPLPTRKEINGRIIRQTFREALDKRDQSLVNGLGRFVSSSWGSHYLRGEMGRNYYSMEYQRLFRDTAAYIPSARNYYNRFYYPVDPDSLAKLDFFHERGADIPRRGRGWGLDSAENVIFQKWIEKYRQRYQEDQARALSFGARQLLDFGIGNSEALFDAIRWQKKAIELRPGRGQYHHTQAQLLYHVGLYVEAEAEQRKAISLSKSDKRRNRQMREALKLMQARSL